MKSAADLPVIVIGGGAAGLAAAYGLAMEGVPVEVFEFGPPPNPAREFLTDTPPERLLRRGLGHEGLETYHPSHFIEKRDLPYHMGNEAFRSFLKRVRVGGGKSLYWTAHAPRFGDLEFQSLAKTGKGENWPIDYNSLAAWYARAERLLGVTGVSEGLIQHPDGVFQKPLFDLREGERLLQRSLAERDLKMILARKAIANGSGERPACHGCGRCALGCRTAAKYDAYSTLARYAGATGFFVMRFNVVVSEILTDCEGKARGVRVINRNTLETAEYPARAVIVAAAAVETARLLLDSESPDGGRGLANSSGLVGAFLSESVGVEIEGLLPPLKNSQTPAEPHHGEHGLIPRHINLAHDDDASFAGGWLFLTQSGRDLFPSFAERIPGFGESWKREIAAWHPALVRLYGIAEVDMRRANRVTLDPLKKDRWGRALPRIAFSLSDADRARWNAMADAGREFLEDAGADFITVKNLVPETGGGLHACGTCRMGDDPKTSVTNNFGQTHDISNLFIADASVFVSSLNQPTLTVTALALRLASHLAKRLKKGG
jgi:choline dehydrogenase-like flavoprotein